MKAGLLSQRRTSSTKKMLRCHLCLLPKRIITIFLHIEGMVVSFEGVKKNAISTKYREGSSGEAQLQSSARILGSCQSFMSWLCFLSHNIHRFQSPKVLTQPNKDTNPPLTHLFKVQCGHSWGAGGGTGGASCAAHCSLTAPTRLQSRWSLLGRPRPERRLWSQSSSFPPCEHHCRAQHLLATGAGLNPLTQQ